MTDVAGLAPAYWRRQWLVFVVVILILRRRSSTRRNVPLSSSVRSYCCCQYGFLTFCIIVCPKQSIFDILIVQDMRRQVTRITVVLFCRSQNSIVKKILMVKIQKIYSHTFLEFPKRPIRATDRFPEREASGKCWVWMIAPFLFPRDTPVP